MTKTELQQIIKTSKSYRDAAKKIGNNHKKVKQMTDQLEIDCSHFKFGKTYEDMVGQRFGMLVVVEIKKLHDEHRRTAARCSCDCGSEKTVRADSLKEGRYVSCGCHSKNRWNMVCQHNPAFTGVGELRSVHCSNIKRSATRRGLSFEVTTDYLWQLYLDQNRTCALTGLAIGFGRVHYPNETSASLDRIDNSQGYIVGNVRWVLKDINMVRGDYDTEYFIKLCNLVAKQHPRSL